MKPQTKNKTIMTHALMHTFINYQTVANFKLWIFIPCSFRVASQLNSFIVYRILITGL